MDFKISVTLPIVRDRVRLGLAEQDNNFIHISAYDFSFFILINSWNFGTSRF